MIAGTAQIAGQTAACPARAVLDIGGRTRAVVRRIDRLDHCGLEQGGLEHGGPGDHCGRARRGRTGRGSLAKRRERGFDGGQQAAVFQGLVAQHPSISSHNRIPDGWLGAGNQRLSCYRPRRVVPVTILVPVIDLPVVTVLATIILITRIEHQEKNVKAATMRSFLPGGNAVRRATGAFPTSSPTG